MYEHSGDKLTIFIVNRSLEDTITDIQLDSFAETGTARLLEVTADHYESINDAQNPDNVVCKAHDVPILKSQVTCSLRASSVYVLEITR